MSFLLCKGHGKEPLSFVQLVDRTPIYCAVAKNHRLSDMKKLTMQDLNGEYIVMPIEDVSKEAVIIS